ncbi:MAG: efflux RND transporter permease subunit [Gammaproteobacteria bacterium]|nr:efflux RND transporter permease subunit [Gammaproteobacteria bacterium]MDH3805353.1 efflux RND transporter permease subunit [Gammaproteobacteria bacterium]
MNLTAAAIDKNRVTLTIVVLVVLAGAFALQSLPKAQDPGFVVRTAVITTRFPGASPERVELLVTDKIEKKIQEMPEIDSITSESRTGISLIYANFKESYKVMRPIFDDLRRKVDAITPDLPQGTGIPEVNDEFGDVFGSVYTLSGDGFSYAELKTVADELRDELLKEPDIAKVSIHGEQQEVIFVEYNNARLAELGLSPQQLSASLASVNILSSGGDIISGRERITLEPSGNFESVEDLQRTVIQLPGGALVYLEDIVDVYRGYKDPPRSVSRVNGEPTLAIAVSMRDGGDILKLGERLDILMPELVSRYPWGIKIDKVWFQADLVDNVVRTFTSSLVQAIVIVILVMIAFLGLRTGLVVGSLIPTTIVASFFAMQLFDITINQISLTALIISLGLLVDNAIVIVESILVRRERGEDAITAAIESGKELKMPLLVSSLTTAAAFMPIAMAKSAVGEYTADIFYVVGIALLSSWLLAMTFVPMVTTVALKIKPTRKEGDEVFAGRWYALYRNLLTLSLRCRYRFLAVIIGLFMLAVVGMGLVRQEFIAPSEDPVFSAKLELPLGTSIETSQEIIAQVDQFIAETYFTPAKGEPLIRNWLTFIGEGGPRFQLSLNPPNPNPANSFVITNTLDGKDVVDVIAGIESYVRENHPDLAAQVKRLDNGPPVDYPIIVRIAGNDFDALYSIADQVIGFLYSIPQVSDARNSWGLQTKKLSVDVDQELARRSGVTSEDVAYSLQAGLTGIDLTQYREGDELIPVTLRTIAADRQDFSKLDGLTVYSQGTGANVPLKQVANVTLTFEPGIIERRDRDRTLSLNVQLRPEATAAEVVDLLVPWLETAAKSWPAGHDFEIGGETEESGDANASIAAELPIAGMLILLLLVYQFNSLRKPAIIVATIPLGLVGVTFGLLAANSSFGFFTILGLISLSGIIINNAIVLLDRIAIEIRDFGRSQADAIMTACQQRMRPILLTTATTVLGMTPLLWGGTAMFKPMAITIIFGLAFATGLTLLVVPVLYSMFFRVSFVGTGQVWSR